MRNYFAFSSEKSTKPANRLSGSIPIIFPFRDLALKLNNFKQSEGVDQGDVKN